MKTTAESVRRRALSDLEYQLLRSSTKFVNACKTVLENPDLHLSLSKKDMLRVLNLETWSEKFQISYMQALEILITLWSGRFVKTKKSRQLGVKIGTLLGRRSRQLLLETIGGKYPEGENRKIWRDAQADSISNKLLPVDSEVRSFVHIVEDYREELAVRRLQESKLQKKLQRRRFRTNPFIH